MSVTLSGFIKTNSVVFGTGSVGGLVFTANVGLHLPFNIIASSDNNNLYVASNSTSGLVTYVRDPSTGTLDAGTFLTVAEPYGMAISPDNKFLYAADLLNSSSARMRVYSRNLSTGQLTSSSVAAWDGASVQHSLISPDGLYLYTALPNGIYNINTTTGALTPPIYPSVGTAVQVMSPDGNYIYTADLSGLHTHSRNVSTGALSTINTTTLTSTTIDGICISPDGTSIYVTNFQAGVISAVSVNTSTGIPTGVVNVTTGPNPTDITISPDGTKVFVVTATTFTTAGNYPSTIYCYTRDTSSGALTANGTAALSFRANVLCIPPDGNNLYITNQNQNNLTIYSIV